MPWVLRQPTDEVNPTLPGGIYGDYITAGRGVYYFYDSGQSKTICILFIADGGWYGLDRQTQISYKGDVITGTEYRFHRGMYTKQITPVIIHHTTIATNIITTDGDHNLSVDDPIKLHATDGILPVEFIENTIYYVKTVPSSSELTLSETVGGTTIDITDVGTGYQTLWKADAGWDDPDMGLDDWLEGINETFSGISYDIVKLNTTQLPASEEPEWDQFRFEGRGRRLMGFDADGAEEGVIADGDANEDELYNLSLQWQDCFLVDYKGDFNRLDHAAFYDLRTKSNELIWFGIPENEVPDKTDDGDGLLGRYYNHPPLSATPGINDIPSFDAATLVLTRKDPTVDFTWGALNPAEFVHADWFMVKWEGWIKPKTTGITTFAIQIDDGARLTVGSQVVIDQWDPRPSTGGGTYSGNYNFLTDDLVPITLELYEQIGLAQMHLLWTPPSEAQQVVAEEYLYSLGIQVTRYKTHFASAEPQECFSYLHVIQSRAVGWHWTNTNGLITPLPPDRPLFYTFIIDPNNPDSRSTILDQAFNKRRRHRSERKNFRLFKYRRHGSLGYPVSYVEGNRQRLRDLSNGTPTNDPPTDLGLVDDSLAERIAENEMIFQTDAKHQYTISSDRASGVVKKGMRVKVVYYRDDNKEISVDNCLVGSRVTKGDQLDFTVAPIPFPFYTDEPVDPSRPILYTRILAPKGYNVLSPTGDTVTY